MDDGTQDVTLAYGREPFNGKYKHWLRMSQNTNFAFYYSMTSIFCNGQFFGDNFGLTTNYNFSGTMVAYTWAIDDQPTAEWTFNLIGKKNN